MTTITNDSRPSAGTGIEEVSLDLAPEEALRAFLTAWEAYTSGGPWTAAYAGYTLVRATLGGKNGKEWRVLIAALRDGEGGSAQALLACSKEARRRYRSTPEFREKERARDQNRAKTPKRQATIRAARKRHKDKEREKARVERLSQAMGGSRA